MNLATVALVGVIAGLLGSLAAGRVIVFSKHTVHSSDSLRACLYWTADVVAVGAATTVAVAALVLNPVPSDALTWLVATVLLLGAIWGGYWLILLATLSESDLFHYPRSWIEKISRRDNYGGPTLVRKLRIGLVFNLVVNLSVALYSTL